MLLAGIDQTDELSHANRWRFTKKYLVDWKEAAKQMVKAIKHYLQLDLKEAALSNNPAQNVLYSHLAIH